jgi:hypothetical protein
VAAAQRRSRVLPRYFRTGPKNTPKGFCLWGLWRMLCVLCGHVALQAPPPPDGIGKTSGKPTAQPMRRHADAFFQAPNFVRTDWLQTLGHLPIWSTRHLRQDSARSGQACDRLPRSRFGQETFPDPPDLFDTLVAGLWRAAPRCETKRFLFTYSWERRHQAVRF